MLLYYSYYILYYLILYSSFFCSSPPLFSSPPILLWGFRLAFYKYSSHSFYTCRWLVILIYIPDSSNNLTPHVLSDGNVEWCVLVSGWVLCFVLVYILLIIIYYTIIHYFHYIISYLILYSPLLQICSSFPIFSSSSYSSSLPPTLSCYSLISHLLIHSIRVGTYIYLLIFWR